MKRRPPRSTRTDTLFPYTTLFRSFTQSIAAITLPNESSVRLHEAIGFEQAGVYRDVGYKLGQWLSVGLWQRPLAPMRERSEEHTSELQSLMRISYAVFCLKKKKTNTT